MLAFHVRTSEPDRYDPMCLENFKLDSLLIKDASILIGYIPHNKREGRIVSYPCPSTYSKRFQDLINGDKSVEGEIISKMELEDIIVEKIRENYDPELREDEKVFHKGKKVFLGWDYQETTQELVYILSDGFTKDDISGKRKKVKEKASIKHVTILEPLPALQLNSQ